MKFEYLGVVLINVSKMTHSPNSNRKKRSNECEDFDHIHTVKRARTRDFDDEIAHIKDNVSCIPQSSHHYLTNTSENKEHIFHQSSAHLTNEFYGSISVHNAQFDNSSMIEKQNPFNSTNDKYLPDLNANENPHYYENNRLLFELYVERLRRSSPNSASTSHQF